MADTAHRARRQEATFINWLNAQFARAKKLTPETKIQDLAEDLKSGTRLIKLMAILCPNLPMPKYDQTPKMKFAEMENLNRAFKMIQDGGIKIVGIGADNIADGNRMMILGLVWSIIYHVRIGAITISDDGQGKSGREGLLYWCQKQTAPYAPQGVKVVNFTSSWRDGLALAAILHHNRPGLLDFEKMKALGDRKAVITECIRVAEESLEVPHLLEVEDMMIADDEKVIMAFISEFFQLFSKQMQVEDALRRAKAFLERQVAIEAMRKQYESGAQEFKAWVDDNAAQVKLDVENPSLEDAWERLQQADALRESISKEKLVQCQRLIGNFDNIQLTSKAHSRKAYQPTGGIPTGPELKALQTSLADQAWEYVRMVRLYYSTEKAQAEKKYIQLLEQLNDWLKAKEQEASAAMDADVDQIHTQLDSVLQDLNTPELLNQTREAMEHLERNGVPNHTVTGSQNRWDETCWKFGQIKDYVNQKKAFVEVEKMATQSKGIPQSKFDEYRDIFKLFDTKHNNSLDQPEFHNCLKGLGIQVADEDVDSLYLKFSVSGGGMSFDKFIEFMSESTGDTQSKDQVLASFKTLAQNKEILGNDILEQFGDELGAFCLSNFPKSADGFQYTNYIDAVFSEGQQ